VSVMSHISLLFQPGNYTSPGRLFQLPKLDTVFGQRLFDLL
jgi:hypothetical protein